MTNDGKSSFYASDDVITGDQARSVENMVFRLMVSWCIVENMVFHLIVSWCRRPVSERVTDTLGPFCLVSSEVLVGRGFLTVNSVRTEKLNHLVGVQ